MEVSLQLRGLGFPFKQASIDRSTKIQTQRKCPLSEVLVLRTIVPRQQYVFAIIEKIQFF